MFAFVVGKSTIVFSIGIVGVHMAGLRRPVAGWKQKVLFKWSENGIFNGRVHVPTKHNNRIVVWTNGVYDAANQLDGFSSCNLTDMVQVGVEKVNVEKMKLLGVNIEEVTEGKGTLKEAVDEVEHWTHIAGQPPPKHLEGCLPLIWSSPDVGC